MYHRELLRTIPHHHGQSAALSRSFLAAPHCARLTALIHHPLPIEPLAPSLHFMASRISKSIGLLGHCVLIGPWALHVRRFGYRPALRDIFLLTTWIPRSPNHVAQCADGEPHAFSLLILSLLSLYFCLPSLALRNVGMRDNVQYTSESINPYAPGTDTLSPPVSPQFFC